MRIISGLTLAVFGSIGLLTACGGGSLSSTGAVPVAIAPAQQKFEKPTPAEAPNDLYVVEYDFVNHCDCANVDILNSHYKSIGSITNGIGQYIGSGALDAVGNLYVANVRPASVVEYAPGQWNAPSFTYTADMVVPSAVTADSNGNVYEADSQGYAVNEYAQGKNSVVASCSSTSDESPSGVAVDSSGDVFVAILKDQILDFWECQGGLGASCTPKVLPVSGQISARGLLPTVLALDKNRNLVVATGYEVAVIDAPDYSSVSRTIGSGFFSLLRCAAEVAT